MAVEKICGIETEYGIVRRGTKDSNPVASSSVLVNAYAGLGNQRVGWDFEDEHPGRDARSGLDMVGTPDLESHLVNTVLTNGARFYVDHAHPEYSSPECRTPMEATRYDLAGEYVLRAAMDLSAALLPEGQSIVVYKNNSDGKGNSYGCHENYLVARSVPFDAVVRAVMAHFVTRQVIVGAGKVAAEAPTSWYPGGRRPVFQLSQRADFMEETVGLETTIKRPIVNTRDEPHADPGRFRRLHVIVGDANRSEVATFLKLATTSLLLAMVEDDYPIPLGVPDDPVSAIRTVSCDPTLRATVGFPSGQYSGLDVQEALCDAATRYVESGGGVQELGDDDAVRAVSLWREVIDVLRADPEHAADCVDWVAKYRLVDAYRERHDCDWSDPRLAALDLQYHDLRPQRSTYERLGLRRLIDPVRAQECAVAAPDDTRAWFRGECLRRWPRAVVAANWDSVVLDVGSGPLRRIPMMDPTRGTRAIVGAVVAACASPAELLERLAD